jgi:hypothetical protein
MAKLSRKDITEEMIGRHKATCPLCRFPIEIVDGALTAGTPYVFIIPYLQKKFYFEIPLELIRLHKLFLPLIKSREELDKDMQAYYDKVGSWSSRSKNAENYVAYATKIIHSHKLTLSNTVYKDILPTIFEKILDSLDDRSYTATELINLANNLNKFALDCNKGIETVIDLGASEGKTSPSGEPEIKTVKSMNETINKLRYMNKSFEKDAK